MNYMLLNIFFKLDLKFGYHWILIQPEDRFKTAFRTHRGHYEWLSPSWQEHLILLVVVLHTLQHVLFMELSKCCFGQLEVDLGHIVSRNGVAMDTSQVQALVDWPAPNNVK